MTQKTNNLAHAIQEHRKALVTVNGDYKGRCFDFYLDVKKKFPQAIALYDHNHVLVLIDGIVMDSKSVYLPFKELSPERYKKAKDWSK